MIKSSLALKLAVVVLIFSTLILGAVAANSYFYSRKLIVQQAEELSRTRGREVANQLAVILKPIEQSVRNIGLAMEDVTLTSDSIASLTHLVVENNPNIFGMAIAFEPYGFAKNQLFFAPYSYRDKTSVKTTLLGSSDYRYFYMDWYQLPRELDHPVWTEPYYDDGGANAFMTTYSAPFYRVINGKKQFAGVITADITLAWLQKLMSAIKLYNSGYAMLLSREGTFIYHPRPEYLFNETVFSLAEELNNPRLWQIGRNMINGKTGFLKWKDIENNRSSFLLYMPLPIDGWSLAMVFPTDEVLESVDNLTRNTLLIGLIGFILFSATIALISRRITRPIHDLSRATLEIAKGNLKAELPTTHSRDEVGRLTQSFGLMQESLQEYIVNLKKTTAAKERIENELKIAHDIQMGLLPKAFPGAPKVPAVEMHALLEPARQVGGDLYDCFVIDDEHIFFSVGDVSDKGVPAALFMAVTKTLFRAHVQEKMPLVEVVQTVNNELCRDNTSQMFVTMFCCIINIRTGEIECCDGGHENPFILYSNQTVEMVEKKGGMALGFIPDTPYESETIHLEPGDTFFLYTDGVNEAMNTAREQFSVSTLKECLEEICYLPVEEITKHVMEKVHTHAGDEPQSDDITVFAIRFKGNGGGR